MQMRDRKALIHSSLRVLLGVFLFAALTVAAWPQTAPDFSGIWKQDNDRSQPKRSGNVTLHIEHHDPELTVETTISPDSTRSRHAMQRYSTDGRPSVSTGADGDEFHTSAAWKKSSLVFSVEEHEGGRILLSQETWSLIENGTILQRIRESRNGEKQILLYCRNKC